MERQEIHVCRILVERPFGKWSLGRPQCNWKNTIKRNLSKLGCEAETSSGSCTVMALLLAVSNLWVLVSEC
jgi:hypothetical protein